MGVVSSAVLLLAGCADQVSSAELRKVAKSDDVRRMSGESLSSAKRAMTNAARHLGASGRMELNAYDACARGRERVLGEAKDHDMQCSLRMELLFVVEGDARPLIEKALKDSYWSKGSRSEVERFYHVGGGKASALPPELRPDDVSGPTVTWDVPGKKAARRISGSCPKYGKELYRQCSPDSAPINLAAVRAAGDTVFRIEQFDAYYTYHSADHDN